jgi:uncharacterized cupredoxin-like copper-binding protein
MRLAPSVFLVVVVALVAACSSSAASPAVSAGGLASAPVASASAAASAPPASAPSSPAPATRIDVTLTDQLKIEPPAMTVPAGVPVTFVITNAGVIDHEFYLGDEAAQTAHEAEMQEMGAMGHDDPEGIAVDPGETRELTYTFDEPGETLAGCHVVGHYGGGMKATITITE